MKFKEWQKTIESLCNKMYFYLFPVKRTQDEKALIFSRKRNYFFLVFKS